MKVALVHSFYGSKTPSGENIVVQAQRLALQEAGFEVRLLAARTDTLAQSPTYALRTAANVITGNGISPIEQLQEFSPDIVHVHNLFPNYSTKWLKQWAGPLVTTQHNFRPMCASGILFRDNKTCTLCPDHGSYNAFIHGCYRDSRVASIPLAVRNRGGVNSDALLSRADRVLLLSERSRRIYTEAGLPTAKVEVVPNFVDDQDFRPDAKHGNDWVYIGRLTSEKGVDALVNNWPSNKCLRIYGDGPLMDTLAARERPNIFFEGKIDRERVPEALSSARGLVFSSVCAEGAVPLTYVEALAAGRPVVAYNGNGAADDIEESSTGVTFSDWSLLGAALEQVESQHQHYSENALDRYQRRYTKKQWLESISELYLGLIREYRA